VIDPLGGTPTHDERLVQSLVLDTMRQLEAQLVMPSTLAVAASRALVQTAFS